MRGFLFLFFGLSAAATQKQNIPWDLNKLKWCDFEQLEKRRTENSAMTYSATELAWTRLGDGYIMSLTATFNPNKSWVIKKSMTSRLLNHEQRHFDITELKRRQMMQEIETLYLKEGITAVHIDSIFSKHNRFKSDMQNKYDAETDHGVNTVEQMKWNNIVDSSLLLLRNQKKTELYIELD